VDNPLKSEQAAFRMLLWVAVAAGVFIAGLLLLRAVL